MKEAPQHQEPFVAPDEISLLEIKQFFAIFKGQLIRSIILILIPVIIFGVIGYLAAVTSPKEYDAKCTLITDQVASSGTGSLQGLAALAGLAAPQAASSELGADLYPMILANRPFLIELSKQYVYSAEQKKKLTFEQIFDKKVKANIVDAVTNMVMHPSTIKSTLSDADTINLSKNNTDTSYLNSSNLFFSNEVLISELTTQNKKMIGILQSRIKFSQTGKLITLSVKMPEARLSAEATNVVLNLLIKYITKFRTSKQLETMRWLEARTAESEARYKASQQSVAGFKDNNYHVIFESVQTKEALLQNEFSLAAGLYNTFVSQLEQAKIQLKKDTPLFTVVEPVYIPDGVSPDANKLIVSYATTGFLIGLIFVVVHLIKVFIRSRRQKKIQVIHNEL